MDTEDLFTVDQAAKIIDISARGLRGYLTRNEYAERTVKRTRQTATGNRESTMLPRSLVDDLAAAISSSKTTRQGTRNDETRNTENVAEQPETFRFSASANGRTPNVQPAPRSGPGGAADDGIAALLASYEARIADLQTALDRERLAADQERAAASDLRRLLDQQQRLMGAMQQAQPVGEIEASPPEKKRTAVAGIGSGGGLSRAKMVVRLG